MGSRSHPEGMINLESLSIEGAPLDVNPDELLAQLGFSFSAPLVSHGSSVHSRPSTRTTQPPASRAASELPPAKPCRSKRWQVPNAKWEEHKQTLYGMYIVDGLTLEKTMSVMEKNYGFQASKRMYKDRFRSWGMFKNMREKDVQKVAQELNERPDRDSEVLLNGRKISMERVHRSLAKHGKSVPEAEVTGIIVQTPSATDMGSPLAMGTTATAKRTSHTPLFETDGKGPFDVQSFHGRGLSMNELLALKAKAVKQILDDQVDEAILSLRTALTGLRDLYKPTHPNVVGTAWCLVDAHAVSQDIQNGDDVINWISNGYSQHLNLWHPRTLDHYLRVVERLQASRRRNDARSLGFRLFTAIRDKIPSTQIVPARQCSERDDGLDCVADDAEFQRIFDERSDMDEIDQQLKLARIWSVARLPGMQSVMEKLVPRLMSLPSVLRGREVEARCIYIRVLVYKRGHEIARSECKLARDLLAELILHDTPPPFEDLIRLSKELVHVHNKADDSSGFHIVQKWTSNRLEDRILKPFLRIDDSDNASALIGYFTDIGLGHQHRSEQKDAQVWFERAYGLSVKALGSHHVTSRRLERAVKEGEFDDGEFLRFE